MLEAIAVLMGRAPADPLVFPARRDMLELVRANPGLPSTEVKTRLGMGWGAFEHHLRVLVAAGHIRVLNASRQKLLFTSAQPLDEGIALLYCERSRLIAAYIMEHSGSGVSAISTALALPERNVYYHVARLAKAGLVESDSQFNYRGLRGTMRLARLLARRQEAMEREK